MLPIFRYAATSFASTTLPFAGFTLPLMLSRRYAFRLFFLLTLFRFLSFDFRFAMV